MIRLWNKLVTKDETRICNRVFHWDYSTPTNSWSSDVKVILSCIGLEDKFHSKEPSGLSEVNNKHVSKTNRVWKDNVVKFPKLRTYKLFKSDYCRESYV